MQTLPSKLKHVTGYREDVIIFARSTREEALVTNIDLSSLPGAVTNACQTSSELAVIAAMHHLGFSLDYFENNEHCQQRLAAVSRDFAAEFLTPLAELEKTVILELGVVGEFFRFGKGRWWQRFVGNPVGTNFG